MLRRHRYKIQLFQTLHRAEELPGGESKAGFLFTDYLMEEMNGLELIPGC